MQASTNARSIALLLTSVLLPLAALTLFTPFYQTNDDVAMRLLAEGNFVPGDEPVPYLMFVNILLGKLLSLAYQMTVAVPWYDLILGASLLVASIALIHTWLGSGRPVDIAWALLLAAYLLFPMFVSVQFSLSGLGCAAAGVGLIARAGIAELEPKPRRLHLLLGTILFFWGSLIRFEGAVLIAIEGVALVLPFVVGMLRNADARPRLRAAAGAAGAAFLLMIVGFAVNQLAYRQNPGWRNFYEYNLLRSRVAEYITPERMTPEATDKLAKQVGWSSNDFLLFRNWFFTDPELFSLDKVRQAERLFYGASNTPTEDGQKARRQRGLDLGKAFFQETRWAFLLMGAFVLARGPRPKLVLYFAGIAVMLAVLIVGIGLSTKAPPQRVFWPMLILAVTMLTIAAQRWGRPMHWSVAAGSILLALGLTVMSMRPLAQESERRHRAAEIAQSDVEGLRRTGATLFILHAGFFPYEDFWTPLHPEKTPFDFVGLGASARTPPVQNFLTGTKRTDLPWSLCTDPAMAIITGAYIPPMLVAFVEEHRGAKVQFEEVFRGQRFSAWKCHRI